MDSFVDRAVAVFKQARYFFASHRYQLLRQQDEFATTTRSSSSRFRLDFRLPSKWSPKHLVIIVLTALIGIALIIRGLTHSSTWTKVADLVPPPPEFSWQAFPLEKGYFDGLRTFVPSKPHADDGLAKVSPSPVKYSPVSAIPNTENPPRVECFLDEEDQISPPAIWAYPGTPQRAPDPMLGSYDVLGLNNDVCFDRYGRYGAYGLGYEVDQGGIGLGIHGDMSGTEMTLDKESRIDWRKINPSRAQIRCVEKNRHRFSSASRPSMKEDQAFHHGGSWPGPSSKNTAPSDTLDPGPNQTESYVPRTAIVLRLWDTYEWTNGSHMYMRSLINELSLYTGGEYSIHLLIQIKDSTPIWASEALYNNTLARVVPSEYAPLATLWSEDLMTLIYPGPFEPQFNRPGPIHSVGRSMHMALQWFAAHHPEYEFFWNWEMDLRYVGHWYELFARVHEWSERQPRKGMWERSGRFYIPEAHGTWEAFSRDTEEKALNASDDAELVSGPQYFQGWDAQDRAEVFAPDSYLSPSPSSDPADYMTFLPIFQPASTFWIFRADVSGYSTEFPIPPRRAAIVTASRFSRRLLTLMHRETYLARHSMGGEMFPASIALHHGLKVAFAPHAMFFDRDWRVPASYNNDTVGGSPGYVDRVFNAHPVTGESGGYKDSVFSEVPQHNFRGGTYYYDSGFAGRLWRRWLGYVVDGEGGARWEMESKKSRNGDSSGKMDEDGNADGRGTGRMCLRSVLLHPIKWEEGDVG